MQSRCASRLSSAMTLSYLCCIVSGAQVTRHAQDSDGDLKMDAWTSITGWMKQHGAVVGSHVTSNATYHGGNCIRGVVSTASLAESEVLVKVPRKMWIEAAKIPAVDAAKLEELDGCAEHVQAKTLKLAAVVAIESKKGNNSFWHPWLSTLPTLSDFKEFHPSFLGNTIMRDFGALPTVVFAERQQFRDRNIAWCFDSWKNAPGSPVAHVDWDDMQFGLINARTRAYHVDGRPIMMPGTDLVNTARADQLNTKWEAIGEFFTLSAWGPVAAHVELYESYCVECTNNRLLQTWGVYEEDNINVVNASEDKMNCNAWTWGHKRSLRDVVEETVDTTQSGLAFAKANELNAPRCRTGLPTREQGSLRCSFARLAWEYCAQSWGYRNEGSNMTSLQSNQSQSGPAASPKKVRSFLGSTASSQH